jgi:class 3 adenylate cyclase
VHRSFAFIDVSGFTALTDVEGDERAVDVLTAFRSLLRDICARRGVRIAKWLGDGAMLVCVDTRPLLETVLELHYVVTEITGPVKTVSIRSGISSGDVILMEGDDYIGHCVNVASRLCDLAPASEAWAAPSVMDHMPSWGVAANETPVSLRGVEKAVPASSIRMALAGGDRARRPRLHGALLLARLRRHLATQAVGQSRRVTPG